MKQIELPDSKWMSVRDAARALEVHENTIRNWMKAGLLSHTTLPSGYRRPSVAAVRKLMRS